jgi:ubiquinone/menaquinone biosynthesis C-methylase UbiE
MDGSYSIENIAVNEEREIKRLNAQVDLFWPQELAFYRRCGLKDGMRVLDCGCGPVYMLEKLREPFPSMEYVGIELAESLVSYARKTIEEKKLPRCNVSRQSITAIDFPESSFDFVICRLVLEHLPDASAGLKEVMRVLKTGGKAIFIDNDFDFHLRTFPPVPELSDLYLAYCSARTKEGGDPRIGRRLPALLAKAGFSDIALEMLCSHNTIMGDEIFGRSEGSGIALQLIRDGFLSSDCYDRLALNWSVMLKTPGHSMVRHLFACCGQKTTVILTENLGPAMQKRNKEERAGSEKSSASFFARGLLVEGLIAAAAEAMDSEVAAVSEDKPLGDIGFDSVASVMFRNTLERRLGVALPSIDYSIEHSIQEIAHYIKDRLKAYPTNLPNSENGGGAFEEGII